MVDNANTQGQLSPKEILTALDRTGFLFEYRVAQRLRQADLATFLNHVFKDPDTGKSREIDIIAHLEDKAIGEGIEVLVSAIHIVECKNYEDPLVIIGETSAVYQSNPIITFDPLLLDFPEHPKGRSYNLPGHLNMWQLPSHSTKGFVGTQLIKMRRQNGKWQAGNDSVYDSIVYPLFKATNHHREDININERDNPHEVIDRRLRPTLYYLLPALITSGNVYKVDVTSDVKPTVTQAGWAPLVRHFNDGLFRMDVVAFDHIEEYIQERSTSLLADATNALTSGMHIFNPQWLREKFGTPLSDPEFHHWLVEFNSKRKS